jgi:hypothetical protein
VHGVQDGIESEQGSTFLRPIADKRPTGEQPRVVFKRSGTGEEEPLGVGTGLIKRPGPQVVEPIEDTAAARFVKTGITRVVEQVHARSS